MTLNANCDDPPKPLVQPEPLQDKHGTNDKVQHKACH